MEYITNNEAKKPIDGLSAMGKPITMGRRANADKHCKEMGLTDHDKRIACINGMSEQLERDNPYEAMSEGMKYLDLTGTYRLMAVLLTATKGEIR